MKRNDMYRIIVDNSYQAKLLQEVEKNQMVESSKEEEKKEEIVFSENYFYNMTLKKWIRIKVQGNSYTPRTGHECLFY